MTTVLVNALHELVDVMDAIADGTIYGADLELILAQP
jgi:hypothetical protein